MTHSVVSIGAGFDTARYGHHVTFLTAELQPACAAFEFTESRDGYDRLGEQFQQLRQRFPNAHFHIRIDAAGQYATNLEVFLRTLPHPHTLSVGEPARNNNYRKALFPKRKADPVESHCAARFALQEQPSAHPETSAALQALREIVSRLEAQTRQSTRFVNQLHNLLARVFPELALEADDFQTNWVLQLLDRYPLPARLARARMESLTAIPHLGTDKAERLQAAARATVGSFKGEEAASLVRQLTRQLRQSIAVEDEIKAAMVAAAQGLSAIPILTIPGIGAATAAVLSAKIVDIDRFATPDQLVGYFGIFPEEHSSGVDKNGVLRPGRQQRMSRQGNDLVRKYLWNAAKSATLCNPAVRALYHRLRAKGKRGDVALGHCMRKLLHLVFAVWKTQKPFDAEHYPWEAAETNKEVAGHKPEPSRQGQVVTATDSSVKPAPALVKAVPLDFAEIRAQISMRQVLEHLGHLRILKGSAAQRRGPCPVHGADDPSSRSFSVHLDRQVFQCFHPPCGSHGNVLDLWAAIHRLPLPEAACHLAETFGFTPEQGRGTVIPPSPERTP
jgi:transposase